METLNAVASAINQNLLIAVFVLPIAFCALVAAIWKREQDFNEHAFENILATLSLHGLNVLVLVSIMESALAGFESAMHFLGIPTLPADFWEGWSVAACALIAYVVVDFVKYWLHRFMHTTWAWAMHAPHHSDSHVNAFTAYRFHILEIMFKDIVLFFVLLALQLPEVLPFVVLVKLLISFYVHSDLPFDHGPFNLLLTSPTFHRWHHADVPEAYGKNLASNIPLWDWLFGTYYMPGKCNDVPMGALRDGIEDKNPVKIFLFPFVTWFEMINARWGKRRYPLPQANGSHDASNKHAKSG